MYMQRTQGGLNPRGQQPQSNLLTSTVRSFEGGLNVSDTDLNMSPKYARILDNLERQTDGSLALRPGTRLFSADLWDTTDIVNHVYFNTYIIAVQASGAWTKIDGTGDGTNMELVAAPAGTKPWSPTTYASFAIFNSDLIGCNGVDKPIRVEGTLGEPNYMNAETLVDEGGSGSIFVPSGKYVVTHGQYLIIAGVATDPSTIFISSRGTSGTFFGASGLDNDGVNVDLGPRVSLGSSVITGLVAYRDKLLVTFERGVLPLNLGVYSNTDPAIHTPTDDGFIEEFGCLAHRSLVSVGDDTFFNDNIGVNSINRVNVFNTLRPVRASHLVDPLITSMVQPLSQDQIQRYVFAVYDLRNFRYMLFVPRFENDVIVETVCFSFTNIPTLKIQAWARLRGWLWQSVCRTALQNIIFSRGAKLYSYNFDEQMCHVDRGDDPDVNDGEGEDITFDWEMPWADMKHRMNIKMLRYIALDTQGSAEFTARAYVDNIYTYRGEDAPLMQMTFVGGNAGGYGNTPYGNSPYGGGRRSSDERLWAFPMKFKIMKMRFSGTTRLPLRFVSISVAYLPGSIRR